MKVRLTNVERFNNSLIGILGTSNRSPEAIMRKQGRLLVENILIVTPPSSGNSKSGPSAKRGGEKTVEGNIRRVLNGVPVTTDRKNLSKVTLDDIHNQHKKHRKEGKIRKSLGKKRMRVPTNMLKQYIKAQKKSVGMLAAGWNASAAEFNARKGHYAWIKRHSPSSSAKVIVKPGSITIRMTNASNHAAKVNVMRKRIDWALQRQARNNEKILSHFKRNAQRQGFRIR